MKKVDFVDFWNGLIKIIKLYNPLTHTIDIHVKEFLEKHEKYRAFDQLKLFEEKIVKRRKVNSENKSYESSFENVLYTYEKYNKFISSILQVFYKNNKMFINKRKVTFSLIVIFTLLKFHSLHVSPKSLENIKNTSIENERFSLYKNIVSKSFPQNKELLYKFLNFILNEDNINEKLIPSLKKHYDSNWLKSIFMKGLFNKGDVGCLGSRMVKWAKNRTVVGKIEKIKKKQTKKITKTLPFNMTIRENYVMNESDLKNGSKGKMKKHIKEKRKEKIAMFESVMNRNNIDHESEMEKRLRLRKEKIKQKKLEEKLERKRKKEEEKRRIEEEKRRIEEEKRKKEEEKRRLEEERLKKEEEERLKKEEEDKKKKGKKGKKKKKKKKKK